MSMLEARYFVAKISDAQAVLCDEELATLERLIRKVDDGRRGTVAKLAMRQPFVLFKGLTFQKLCLPGA
ncbi:hypothetical protein B5076_08590, partial [Salmonella enterica subsp. enterica serovar Dublin]|uniref:hypothetical protein n=1 Tax=Salmonella enterica TaxID=28901 RepID=UPI000A0AB04D